MIKNYKIRCRSKDREEAMQYNTHRNDIDDILKIKLPRGHNKDAVAWHYEKTGCFSIKSAYRLSMDWKREWNDNQLEL